VYGSDPDAQVQLGRRSERSEYGNDEGADTMTNVTTWERTLTALTLAAATTPSFAEVFPDRDDES